MIFHITARWREYFQELPNTTSTVNLQAVNKIPQYPVREELALYPTSDEIRMATLQLKNNKAPEQDGLPIEILFKQIWDSERSPADFKHSLIVNIYKRKGDRTDCTNYRGISLLCAAGKILAKVISNRLQPALESILPKSQSGFRPHRGTTYMIFILRQLQEKVREQHSSLLLFLWIYGGHSTL